MGIPTAIPVARKQELRRLTAYCGLAEVRRVTRGEVAFLTCDPALLGTWCTEAWRTRLASVHQRRVSPELSETFAARSVYWAVEYRRPINVA